MSDEFLTALAEKLGAIVNATWAGYTVFAAVIVIGFVALIIAEIVKMVGE